MIPLCAVVSSRAKAAVLKRCVLSRTDKLRERKFSPAPGAVAYWTLLDYSCRAAQGQNRETDFITNVFTPFQNHRITRRRDNRALGYWYPPRTTKCW